MTHEHTYTQEPDKLHALLHPDDPPQTREVCTECGMPRTLIEREATTPRLDLTCTVPDCGGYLGIRSMQGHWMWYECDKCHTKYISERTRDQIDFAQAERDRREAEWEERRRNLPPPPKPTGRYPTEDEANLIEEYRMWSEDHYAAGFMGPSESTVREFMNWQRHKNEPAQRVRMWDYEETMVDTYRRLMEEETHE